MGCRPSPHLFRHHPSAKGIPLILTEKGVRMGSSGAGYRPLRRLPIPTPRCIVNYQTQLQYTSPPPRAHHVVSLSGAGGTSFGTYPGMLQASPHDLEAPDTRRLTADVKHQIQGMDDTHTDAIRDTETAQNRPESDQLEESVKKSRRSHGIVYLVP